MPPAFAPPPACRCTRAALLALALLASPLHAQSTQPGLVLARVQALTPEEREQERLRRQIAEAPPAYVDKVMAPAQADAGAREDARDAQAQRGPFRAWLLETGISAADSGTRGRDGLRVDEHATEFGLRSEYRRQSLNFGEWNLQADARTRDGDVSTTSGFWSRANDATSERVTLRNYGFPITTRVSADSSVGDFYSDVTDAFARSYRLTFGTTAVRGASTRILAPGFELRAGAGERGAFLGGPYPGFEDGRGRLAWLGSTWRLPAGFRIGLQANRADDVVPARFGGGLPSTGLPADAYTGPRENVSSLAAALVHGRDPVTDGDRQLRLMLLGSRIDPDAASARSATGWFFEGQQRSGRYRHAYGAYDAEPDLRFGDYLPLDDTRGAYWRVDHAASRVAWGAGVDWQRQGDGATFGTRAQERVGLNANLQRRFGRDSTIAGTVSIYDTRSDDSAGGDNRSVYANLYYQRRATRWGRDRYSLTLRRDEQLVADDLAATGEELQWEHDWFARGGETNRPELTTRIGYARDRSAFDEQRYPTAGVQYRQWFGATFNVHANLGYSSRTGNLSTNRGLAGTLGFEHALSRDWHLGGYASFNQARVGTGASPFGAASVTRSTDRVAFLFLRWSESFGRNEPLVGARADGSTGAGALQGVVFFDANRDGEQQPDEPGVPSVEVFLDGRYATLTDRDGRYRFDRVATGPHGITVRAESAPLPWGPPTLFDTSWNVPLRGEAQVNVGLVKLSE